MKTKNSSKAKAKAFQDAELTPLQRSILANRIRVQMLTIETDGHVLENMEGIKKLKIMLSLFESAGKEFETFLPLKELDDRYLEVRLRTNRNKPSVVIIRHGTIPGSDQITANLAQAMANQTSVHDVKKDELVADDDEKVPNLI